MPEEHAVRMTLFETVMAQDTSNMAAIQRSVESRGARPFQIGWHERLIHHFHRAVDLTIGSDLVPDDLAVSDALDGFVERAGSDDASPTSSRRRAPAARRAAVVDGAGRCHGDGPDRVGSRWRRVRRRATPGSRSSTAAATGAARAARARAAPRHHRDRVLVRDQPGSGRRAAGRLDRGPLRERRRRGLTR